MQEKSLEKFVEELSHLIRARYPLIYLNSYEEPRCLDVLAELGGKRESSLYVWSRTLGIFKGQKAVSDVKDPMGVLSFYEELNEKSVLVLKDYHPYMKDPGIVRKLRDLSQSLKRSAKNVVFLSPVLAIPPELSKDITILDVPLPPRPEIRSLIEKAKSVLPEQSGTDIESLIDAAMGLTCDEIENVLAKSIVSLGKLDKRLIQDEKKQIVKKSSILEFLESDGSSVPEIGGLHLLKEWLLTRRAGFSPEARALKLPSPKGILLVGIPGCGKSLTAMTVGKEWGLPLLRLDLGKVFSGLVGSSEGNIRAALATTEAVSPCILWIDEIEKGLSGTQSSGSSDGGTTSRVFGTILTWMQEKKSDVFVVATANDISQLPPEFLRKGRFDEIFFVDLPVPGERKEILKIQLTRYGWEVLNLDADVLVEKMDGFSGSEIEQVVISARYQAFSEATEFSQRHLLRSISETVPLSRTMADRIDYLRNWAKHRARFASHSGETLGGPGSGGEDRFELRTNRLERGAL
jgi:hypothetical protein